MKITVSAVSEGGKQPDIPVTRRTNPGLSKNGDVLQCPPLITPALKAFLKIDKPIYHWKWTVNFQNHGKKRLNDRECVLTMEISVAQNKNAF